VEEYANKQWETKGSSRLVVRNS